MLRFVGLAAALCLSVVACSSSSSGGSSGCTTGGHLTWSAVTLAAGSSAACPTITASSLNMNSGDDSGSGCSETRTGCSATLSCGAGVTGSYTISGSALAGSISVTATDPDAGTTLNCTYDLTGTIQ